MKCERCSENVPVGDERDFHGQTLCEDCYMVVLSPPKACDPWAVYCAKSIPQSSGTEAPMTEIQSKILDLLKDTGGAEPDTITARLEMDLPELEREIATLRHMEKVRAELREGIKFICLW